MGPIDPEGGDAPLLARNAFPLLKVRPLLYPPVHDAQDDHQKSREGEEGLTRRQTREKARGYLREIRRTPPEMINKIGPLYGLDSEAYREDESQGRRSVRRRRT